MTTITRYAIILALIPTLALVGCGSDDDDNNDPTGPGGTTEFDQAFAAQQSQFLVTSVISQFADLGQFAGGIAPKADDIYSWGWVDDPGRWEGSYSGSAEGFTTSYNVWLQYLDALGTPQQDPLGAATMNYHADAEVTGSDSGEGYSYTLAFDYLHNFSATGLGTAELLVNGDGGIAIDYTYNNEGNAGSASYQASWTILSPGIVQPLAGCPVGTMEFTMTPYVVTVVYDGSETATYTMRQGSTVIPEGSGTVDLACNNPAK